MNIIYKLKIAFIPCQENNFKPRFLESRFLFYYFLFVLALKIISVSFLAFFPESVFFADITKSSLIEMTNQEREKLGIGILKENSKLDEAALLKAQDILDNDYFDHYSPQGISPWYWFQQVGYNYKTAGENLAVGFLDSKEVYDAWLDSFSHKENLLNPNYNEIGIGIAKGDLNGSETTIVVQLFGSQKKNNIIVSENPTEEITLETTETEPIESTSTLVMGEETEINDPIDNKVVSFLATDYYNLIQDIIYISLISVILSLLVNIFVEPKIQHKDLIFKTSAFIVILLLFVFIDREILLSIIPHTLEI